MDIPVFEQRSTQTFEASENQLGKSVVDPQQASEKLEQLKNNLSSSKKNASGKFMLCFNSIRECERLISDVLLYLDSTQEKVVTINPTELPDYQGYEFAWIEGNAFSLDNNRLTTPNLQSLQQSANKKALWELLSDRG